MITVYKNKKDIPSDKEYIESNDYFFNRNTALKIDERASEIIEKVDGSKLVGKYKIESKFNGTILDISYLSTGCKTVLNVMYYPDKVFCLKECGFENALVLLYELDDGNVYSNDMRFPIDVDKVRVSDEEGVRVLDSSELEEWWEDEE